MDVFDQSFPYHLKKKLWNLKKIDFNVVRYLEGIILWTYAEVFYNSIFTTLKVKLEHQFMFKFWRMLFSEIEPQRSTLDRIEVGKTIKDCKCENQIKLLHRFSLEGSYCFLFCFFEIRISLHTSWGYGWCPIFSSVSLSLVWQVQDVQEWKRFI